MVLGTCGNEWLIRLEKLRAVRDQHPDGPHWLWNIRIRILEFLVSRYSGSDLDRERAMDEKNFRSEFAQAEGDTEWDWPGAPLHRSAWAGTVHPPRTREQVASALDRIECAHDIAASERWKSRRPEYAWQWWRNTYACRPVLKR